MVSPVTAIRSCLLLALLGVIGGACPGWAQNSRSEKAPPSTLDFSLEVFEAEHGLPQNVVTAVVQTRDGYIWAGTFTGLGRFDGMHFTVFDAGRTPGLNNSRITSLFEDRDGTLWIGHETGDISRYQKGGFETVMTSEVWAGGSVVAMGQDARGEVWFVDVLGRLVRASDGHTINSDRDVGSNWSQASLALDGEGHLFLAVGEELQIIENGRRQTVLEGDEVLVRNSQIIAPARNGGVWVLGDGLLRNRCRGIWAEDLGPVPWGDEPVYALLESRSGVLFVGTLNQGLYILSPGLAPVHLTPVQGLPHVWMRALTEDQEGNIWAGTSGGLMVLRPRKVTLFNPPNGWQGRAVLSVTSGADDAIWAGTEGAGVYRFKQGEWTQFGEGSGLTNLYVWSVLEDRQGNLWAGSWGGGLQVLRHGTFEFPPLGSEFPSVVAALAQGREGGLLVGSSAGLLRCAEGGVTWLTSRTVSALPDVRSIAEMRDGSIWFGTPGSGLNWWREGRVTTYRKKDGLPSDFIMALLLDAEQILWIGTLDQGLAFWREGFFGHIGPEAGLPSPLISSIQDDGHGNLWVSSQNGLFRMNKQELRKYAAGELSSISPISYGKPEGMAAVASPAGFQPSSCRTSDGRMWFPTAKGLAVIHPDEVRRNPAPPPVVIEKVLVDEQDQDLREAAGEIPGLGSVPLIVVPPGQRRFEFQYAGLSFTAPDRVRFKTKLEGVETEWTDAGSRRTANYSFLTPGRYVFRVIASNNDGVWNETGDAVILRLLPQFWQQLWFKGALLLVGGMAIVGGIRFETRRRVRHKLERIERQQALERERARIARDIHDDLGASLTRITMLSHTAQEDPADASLAVDYMRQIYVTARELTRSMDEIVWAVNPHHDTLESLVNYLGRYAQHFLSATEIRCRLDVPVQLPAWPVRSEIRHNLYLALKEALNNTVKHADAREVRVTMELGATHFVLIVADDGCGFDPAGSGRALRPMGGHGLTNMRIRLEQVGGRCEIHSHPGEGATVKFFVQVGQPPG